MEHRGVGPPAVIPVDHLAHQPEIGLEPLGEAAQVLHKAKVQHVGGVQPDAVDIKLFHPEPDGVEVVLLHCGVALVQLDQQVVAAPVGVGKAVVVLVVAPEIHVAEPVPVGRAFPVLLQVPEGEKAPAHMVEHPVHDHLLAAGMAGRHPGGELLVGAQAAVHPAVVHRIVAVAAALEQRANIDGAAAQLKGVGGPGVQFLERAGHGLTVVLVGAAAQPQRVNMIKNSAVIPRHKKIHSCIVYRISGRRPAARGNSIPQFWMICTSSSKFQQKNIACLTKFN